MRKHKRKHWLAFWINKEQWTTGAEVGTATGNTTRHILDNCPSLDDLIVVDTWAPIPEATNELWRGNNMKELFNRKMVNQAHRITIHEGLSWEMADKVADQSLDFVFVDASHDYESFKKDLSAWWPKVKHMGLLCGHDLHFEGVKKALEERFQGHYHPAEIDNCWYINKL